MKILYFIFGFLLSIGMVIAGFALTNLFGHGFWVAAFSIAVPAAGVYFFKFQQKQLGLGMLIASIPLAVLAILFLVLSELH